MLLESIRDMSKLEGNNELHGLVVGLIKLRNRLYIGLIVSLLLLLLVQFIGMLALSIGMLALSIGMLALSMGMIYLAHPSLTTLKPMFRLTL
jgi:hypothetical protein